MDNKILSLQHLETLSSADLIALADDYGIDIPDNLNRRFIIGELLEIAEELALENDSPDLELVEGEIEENADSDALPESFNETQISVILRNPSWAYVYWDISDAALKKIEASTKIQDIVLRISYFEKEDDVAPVDYYDVKIDGKTRAQYVLLEAGKKFFRADLTAVFNDETFDNLTVSKKIRLPEVPEILSKAKPGEDVELSGLLELSGMKKLLKSHYEKYRESFTE